MIKDSFFMMISISVRLFSNIIIFLLLARFWDIEIFGLFMYIFTATTLLALIVDYGFVLKLVKDISSNPNKIHTLFSSALHTKIILTAFLLIIGVIWIITFGKHNMLFYILLITAILNSFSIFYCLPFRAINKFKEEAKVSLISNILLSVVVVILLTINAQEILVALGFLFSRLVNLLLSVRANRAVIKKVYLNIKFFKVGFRELKTNFPFAVHTAIGTLYLQIDTILIHFYLGNEGVGLYQSAIRILIAGLVLSEVLTNVYIPRLSRASNDKTSIINIGSNMTRHMFILGTIGSTLMFGLSDKIISILYGSEYYLATTLLEMFAILLFIKYIGSSYGAILTISNKQKTRVIFVSIALGLNIILNIVLIPIMSLKGAILSGIISSVILCICYLYFNWTMLKHFLITKRSIALIIFGAILLLISDIIYNNTSLQLFIAGLVSLLILYLGLNRSEKKKMKNLLPFLARKIS